MSNPVREERFGKVRMILSCPFLKKYKGVWHPDMVVSDNE